MNGKIAGVYVWSSDVILTWSMYMAVIPPEWPCRVKRQQESSKRYTYKRKTVKKHPIKAWVNCRFAQNLCPQEALQISRTWTHTVPHNNLILALHFLYPVMPSITKLLHYLPYLRYFSNFKNILMNSEDFYMLDVCVCVMALTLTVWSWLPVTTLPAAALSTVMGFWWAHCTERVSWQLITSSLL